MREFQDRRRFKKLLHSRYAIAVLLVLSGFLVQAVWGVYGKYEKSREIADRAKANLAELEARQKSLAAAVADINTDQGRDREIRERFGAVKEGEKMIVLIESESPDPVAAPMQKEGWWRRFIGLFTRDQDSRI